MSADRRKSPRGVALALAAVSVLAAACAPLPAWQVPPQIGPDRPIVRAEALSRFELENGLRVIVLEDPRLPRIGLACEVRRGAAVESPKEAGLAKYTAELMERGAGSRNARAFAEAVESLGATLAVASNFDSTSVSLSGLASDEDALYALFADVVLRPRFDGAEAVKARKEALAELGRAVENPATLRSWHTLRALYGSHRYGLPEVGNAASVSKLDAGAARRFHARLFVPNNAVLTVTGAVRADDVRRRVEALFGKWKRGAVPELPPAPPAEVPSERRVVIVDRPELAQAQIAVAHEGFARADERRIPATMLNAVIGGSGFASRMMKKVRSDEGLTYGIGSGFTSRRDSGSFAVATFTRVEKTRAVVDLILAELERAIAEPPDESELERAKTEAAGSFATSLETSALIAGQLANLDVFGLPEDSLETYRERVRAVTTDDTAALAAELLHPERAAIVVVGPAAALRAQLEGLGPIEVVKP
jgi:zinc protease